MNQINKEELARHDAAKPRTVVVIADTHADRLSDLPETLIGEIKAADCVIHLGDFTSLYLLNELKAINNFYGILGNHDYPHLHGELNQTEEIQIGGKKLGLMHALINPISGKSQFRRAFKKRGQEVNAILYGHTHLPTAKFDNGVYYFNPGSVAGKFPAAIKSFGKLTIDGTISGEIITLDTRGTLGPVMYVPCAVARKVVRTVETMLLF